MRQGLRGLAGGLGGLGVAVGVGVVGWWEGGWVGGRERES